MKTKSVINCNYFLKRIALAITLISLSCSIFAGEDQPKAQGKSEATIELSYSKNADKTKTVTATVKVKKDKKFVRGKNAKVNFYVLNNKMQQLFATANTNGSGQAIISLPKDLPIDKDHFFTVAAKIENDPLYEDADEQMHFKDANISLNLNPKDTSQMVTAKLTEIGKDGKEVGVKDVKVKFYVQRLFGIMAAGEESSVSTNEKGEASFSVPKNIPGDTAGGITIVARVEENDQFGTVENKAATSWGAALEVIKDPFPRALWEPYAPLPLVLTISILFGAVWFVYFIVFVQLAKIKSDGKLA